MLNAIEVILICLVAQAALTDLAMRKIPNVLILSGLVLALLLHLLAGPPWAPLSHWFAGAMAGFFLFLPLYLLRGMAAGDVKLMAMVGSFTGPGAALKIAALAYVTGGVMALTLLLFSGRWRQGMRNLALICKPLLLRLLGVPLLPVPLPPSASAGGIPYGVAVALATVGFIVSTHR
ncbi:MULTISPECIES: prepilin peptidase [unclassified Duganella]|jgi:prepilin peptidase CpaA|uniref:A24 family peptidase n=1 Tax=unclassified Duganella TaxID=2636909 RepID=UPI0008897408|nr:MULTISPECIES: prepilin peptidase [unclassified Duganella]SDG94824.1 prepilin peptidase CpaA [Duganella sp. OV458]SDJ47625.1 prepilin peptidase CpaA [Duganella sp. OV510]